MALLKRCATLGCEERSPQYRCPRHRRAADEARQAKRGDFYKGDHARRAKACIAAQPWCSDCGATRDLTAGHTDPRDRNSPLRTQCRGCNAAEANRRRARAGRSKASNSPAANRDP